MLDELVERAARALPGWDCDIVESHHVHKKDAPSGTALTLGESAARGGAAARYASLRAGDIVGEHLVQFAGQGERIELVHRATSRDIFARGALQAATGLARRAPGLYTMRGLLFGIAPGDAVTYAAVLGVVLVAVAIAAYVPARRAARVDPQALLRQG